MNKDTIVIALKNFGLTNKEVEAYILLARKGPLTGTELAKRMKRNKGQIYRILKNLQKKGFVESTLEYPKRFLAVEIEKVLGIITKAKRDELARIDESKNDLIRDWEIISKTENEQSLEKFAIIEGSKKIYQKIAELVENTTNNLSAITSVADLVRAEQFGVFESAYENQKKSKINFRFITDLTKDNLKAIKLLKPKLKSALNVKARNPDLGLKLFPRMIIRDNEEILFFISPKKGASRKQDVCIHTNSLSLVQAFNSVFEEFWCNSTDIEEKIIEIETGIPTPETIIIHDANKAKEKYVETLHTAEKELILMTSENNLIQISKILPIKLLRKRNVIVKILAPITNKNLEVAEKLSKFFQIRHTHSTQLENTIIDCKHLFQLKESSGKQEELTAASSFKDIYYTTDSMYIKKTKYLLGNLWSNSFDISQTKNYPSIRPPIENILSEYETKHETMPQKFLEARKKGFGVMIGVFSEIMINPPACLKIPDLRIHATKADAESSLGEADLLRVDLWLETSKGEAWVPGAFVTDGNPKIVSLIKAKWAGTPIETNLISVKPEALEIWMKGNILFAGWTVPIPLLNSKFKLDPACVWFEKYGTEVHNTFSYKLPSGYVSGCEFDGFLAFTTFISSSWRYSGPGNYGVVGKIIVVDAEPEIS
jgi:sugar-specific transcriptional regulator TrmB